MSVARPTPEQMVDLVESLGMTMTRERVAEFYIAHGRQFRRV
jgi:hypothetical protein